jgi:hypothetical protein
LTHEAFQELTLFELSIWFWEDYYQQNPLEAKKSGDGHVQFYSDDPLIDKWEREIAQGIPPDLTEGMTHEQKEKERRALERLRLGGIEQEKQIAKAEEDGLGGGFSDDYSEEVAMSDMPILGAGSHGKR